MGSATLQEYANAVVAAEYKQPLKTVEQACETVGWKFEDRPNCCGKEVEMRSILGHTYFAECKTCGRFIADLTGPTFSESGSSCFFLEPDKFVEDTDWDCSWIAGTRPTNPEETDG